MFLRYLNFKKLIKSVGYLTKKRPLLHKFLSKTYNFYIIYFLPIINIHKRLKFFRKKNISKILGLQTIKLIHVNNIDLGSRTNLINSLKHLEVKKGGWCLYYKNAFDIIDRKKFLDSYNEKKIGLKILINSKKISSKLKKSSYGLRPFGKYAHVKEILRVGNRMNLLGLGPKIYDLICLEDKKGFQAYAYLVENYDYLEDTKLNSNDLKLFLKKMSKDKWLKPTWDTTYLIEDFEVERDNPNLLKTKNDKVKFLDFQAFSIPNENDYIHEIVKDFEVTSFGEKRLFSKKNYLYQVLPEIQGGKRDTLKRWEAFDKIFRQVDLSLENKVILDVGCNIGMNCYYALSRGSKFAYGIDKEEVALKCKLILNAFGVTRSNIFGLDLKSIKDLDKIQNFLDNDIDIIFYCSIDGHIGYPSQIKELKFKYILHEGHPNTNLDENINKLYSNKWLTKTTSKILFKSYLKDGDSPSRPILLASR